MFAGKRFKTEGLAAGLPVPGKLFHMEGDGMADKNKCLIRAAGLKDLARIEEIARDAFAIYVPRMDRKPFPMLDDYEAHIRAGHLFTAAVAGKIAGYVVLLPGDGHLLLDTLGIHPDFQGKGHGGAIMEFVDTFARKSGYSQIRVYTNEAMRENIRFYGRFGYDISHRVIENGYRRIYFVKNL